ncbi:MAG: hypothetical protein V4541_07795 [Bacteroidota bacterium]
MKQLLTWTKGLFDSNYQIYNNSQIRASLHFSSWKNNARGIALHKNYYFTTEGFFNPVTKIRDENFQDIGVITYHSWQLKATITFTNLEHASWGYTNGWLSQWSISNHREKQIQYRSSTASGTILSNNEDELLLLSGVFIREYFSRIMILILIIIFLPALIRGF